MSSTAKLLQPQIATGNRNNVTITTSDYELDDRVLRVRILYGHAFSLLYILHMVFEVQILIWDDHGEVFGGGGGCHEREAADMRRLWISSVTPLHRFLVYFLTKLRTEITLLS